MSFDYSSDFSVDGTITSSRQGKLMGTADTMPTPTSELEGQCIQYTGPDSTDFRTGHIYICDGTQWSECSPGGAAVTYEGKIPTGESTSVIGVITIDGASKNVEVPIASATCEGVITPTQYTNIEKIPDLITAIGNKEDKLPTYVSDRYLHVDSSGKLEWAEAGGVGKVKVNGTEYGPDTSGIVDIGSLVEANAAITAETKCKLTFDSKGLITKGEDLALTDLPDLTSAKVTAMTGYAIATAKSAIATTDTLNQAVGKLEYGLGLKLDKQTTADAQAAYIVKQDGTNTVMRIAASYDTTGLAQMDIVKNYIDTTAAIVRRTDIKDNCTTAQETPPKTVLSAYQGKVLQDQINNLSAIGRYLSTWDCTTGKPGDDPTSLPYAYKTGDYYIISKTGTPNYIPTGTSYTGAASTTTSTATISPNDRYMFDGTNWSLVHIDMPATTFASIAGSPNDNTNLKSELDKKFTTVTSGEYMYYFTKLGVVSVDASKMTVRITKRSLDNNGTTTTESFEIPKANIDSDTAGLYNKALADVKADKTYVDGNFIKLLGNEATSGQPYHMTYFYSIKAEAEKIVATVNTITLDNNRTLGSYSMDIPKMTDTTAGLYTKSLADLKQDKLTAITNAEIDALAWS